MKEDDQLAERLVMDRDDRAELIKINEQEIVIEFVKRVAEVKHERDEL